MSIAHDAVGQLQPLHEMSIVVGFWPSTPDGIESEDNPSFFIGAVRQCNEIGGGYWQLGVQLVERVQDPNVIDELRPHTKALLPATERS